MAFSSAPTELKHLFDKDRQEDLLVHVLNHPLSPRLEQDNIIRSVRKRVLANIATARKCDDNNAGLKPYTCDPQPRDGGRKIDPSYSEDLFLPLELAGLTPMSIDAEECFRYLNHMGATRRPYEFMYWWEQWRQDQRNKSPTAS